MSDSDPFAAFESERTVIKPAAGRGSRAQAAAPAAAALPEVAPLPDMAGIVGLGPVLEIASPLLITGARIRVMTQHSNVPALRAALVEAVRKFESDARVRGLPNEQVVAGRYLLCTFLDECASSTPWGGSGAWSAQSLLVLFHNETWGGEKLFQLLGKLAENVGGNRSLLELIYAMLTLGFEGRYRVLPDGRAQLATVRERLALMLREQGGTAPTELSPRWAGVQTGRRLRDGIPVWVVATVVALVLAVVFVALLLAASNQSDGAFASLQSMDVKAATVAPPIPPPPAPTPRLAGFLKPEIDAGLVAVRDFADRSVITIQGDGFFEAGSADVSSRVLPLLDRIAQALQATPGQILVSGHTDSVPIRSLRFPSNWNLSQARAKAVLEILSVKVKPERIRSEGLADTQPVAGNESPAGKARNRRVEITLRLG